MFKCFVNIVSLVGCIEPSLMLLFFLLKTVKIMSFIQTEESNSDYYTPSEDE